jgi:hypothetical protein
MMMRLFNSIIVISSISLGFLKYKELYLDIDHNNNNNNNNNNDDNEDNIMQYDIEKMLMLRHTINNL